MPRNPATEELLAFFTYDHLPLYIQPISQACFDLAHDMARRLHDGRELSTGLRKLLEAKDCFVRQVLRDCGDIVTESEQAELDEGGDAA